MPYILLVVVLSVIAQATLAIRAPRDAKAPKDERERLVTAKADHWAGIVHGGWHRSGGLDLCPRSCRQHAVPSRHARFDRSATGPLCASDSVPAAVVLRWEPAPQSPTEFANYVDAHGLLSQAALGQSVGVTRQTIIAIEQGRYSPSLETSFRIARLFGVGLEDVFGWEGE